MGRVTPQLSHPPRGGSRAAPAPPGDCAAGERAPHLPIAHGGNDAENGTARQHRCPGRAGPFPPPLKQQRPAPAQAGGVRRQQAAILTAGIAQRGWGPPCLLRAAGAAAPPGKGCPPAAAVRVPCGWAGRGRSGTATGARPGCCARRPRVAAGTGRCRWAPNPGSRSPQGRVRLSECGGPRAGSAVGRGARGRIRPAPD